MHCTTYNKYQFLFETIEQQILKKPIMFESFLFISNPFRKISLIVSIENEDWYNIIRKNENVQLLNKKEKRK